MGRLLLFLLPQTLSLLGSLLAQYGIIWTLTLRYSSGKVLLAATLASFVPQILLMLLAGRAADRRGRKAVLIVSDLLSALTALILAMNAENTFMMIASLSLRSAFAGVQTPAVDSAIPFLAESEKLERANGLKALLSSAVMLLSPVIAGLLLPLTGLVSLLLLDVLSAAVAILLLLPFHVPEYEMKEENIHGGIFLFLRSHELRRILLFHGIALFLIAPGATLPPLFVDRIYSSSPLALSASEATYSLGMILGGMLIAFAGDQKGRRGIIIALLFYALMLLGMSLSPVFWGYLICNLSIGVISPGYTALMTAEVQRRTAESQMGMSMALLSAVSTAAVPLGMILFAPLADIMAIRGVFMAAGIALIIFIVSGHHLLEAE